MHQQTVAYLNDVNQCSQRPPHRREAITNILKIRFTNNFMPEQIMIMRRSIMNHFPSGLGLTAVEVTSGEDVLITFWRNPKPETNILGMYDPVLHIVHIDIMAVLNTQQLEAVILHELGHSIGMHHICWGAEETDSRGERVPCSPVGYGLAMMNASINPIPYRFTNLDRLERARILWCQTNLR